MLALRIWLESCGRRLELGVLDQEERDGRLADGVLVVEGFMDQTPFLVGFPFLTSVVVLFLLLSAFFLSLGIFSEAFVRVLWELFMSFCLGRCGHDLRGWVLVTYIWSAWEPSQHMTADACKIYHMIFLICSRRKFDLFISLVSGFEGLVG